MTDISRPPGRSEPSWKEYAELKNRVAEVEATIANMMASCVGDGERGVWPIPDATWKKFIQIFQAARELCDAATGRGAWISKLLIGSLSAMAGALANHFYK